MTLIKNKNNKTRSILQSDFNEAFDIDSFLNGSLLKSTLFNNHQLSKIPATNIFEKEKEFVVELAAPGMRKKDFQVKINDNLLEIEVEREDESEKEEENCMRKEYDYTAFYRSFKLPESIVSDKIKAEYEDGILKIHLPKAVETKRKAAKEVTIM